MPINLTLTADSAEELTVLIAELAQEVGFNRQATCNCTNNVTVEANAPATSTEEPTHDVFPSDESSQTDDSDDEISEDDDDEDDDDEEQDDSTDETPDELSGCSDAPNDEIASHFDEIFGTVGNRPMCGDRVTVNGTLYQGGGKVVNTNYGLLYDNSYDYNTKIIKVKADNGKVYTYNKSDLRAKKVIKA